MLLLQLLQVQLRVPQQREVSSLAVPSWAVPSLAASLELLVLLPMTFQSLAASVASFLHQGALRPGLLELLSEPWGLPTRWVEPLEESSLHLQSASSHP